MTAENFNEPLAPPPSRTAPPPPSSIQPEPLPEGPPKFHNGINEDLGRDMGGAPDFKFTAGEGTVGEQVRAIGAYLERLAPYFQLLYLAYENIQRENQKATELWTYVCKGPDRNKEGGICGMQMRAKRPEFRTYAERLICPNPVHAGELTPMEPILPK
ncbi:MAG: hypothetical protein ACHQC8_02475 [Solirubrobacterales bacterium]